MSNWNDRSSDQSVVILTVAGLLVLLVGGGAALFAYQQSAAARAEAERALALRELSTSLDLRAVAETNTARADAVQKFVTELMASPDPAVANSALTLHDVLQAAQSEVRKPEIDPAIREALQLVIRRAREQVEKNK